MKKSYNKSARTQDPQFLGAPKSAAENQGLSALCERGAGVTTKTSPVNKKPVLCPCCGELLRLIRVYPSGRGFEMRCEGTDSNPHWATLHLTDCRKEEVLRILAGALYKW